MLEMRRLGYVLDTKFALHDMESDQKECVLSAHIENLGVPFSLMRLPRGATLVGSHAYASCPFKWVNYYLPQ